MKTPKRKRAPSVATAKAPAAEASLIDATLMQECGLVAEASAESDPDPTTSLPLPDLVAADAVESAIEVAPAVVSAAAPDPIVTLPSNSTVKDAAALKVALLKVAALTATVSLDIRSVERVDTATLQLLYAFVRDRAERKLGVAWLGCPKTFIDSSRLLGVHAMLGLPEVGVA